MNKIISLLLLFSVILCGCNSGDKTIKKNYPVYYDVEKYFNVDIYFFNNNLDIPYVEIKDEVDKNLVGYEFSCEQKGNDYVITNKQNQATMNLNISTGEVSISDVNKFRSQYYLKDGNYIDEFIYNSNDPKSPFIKQERVASKCKYDSTTTFNINLKDYGFTPVIYNNKGYLPIDVLPLITSTDNGAYYLTTDAIYNIKKANSELIKSFTPKTSYSKIFYEYSFNLLSLSIELYYGLKGYSKVLVCDGSTFNYLPNGVLKEFAPYKDKIVNSSSLENFDKSVNELFNTKLLDGGHSYVTARSFGESKKEALPSDKETDFTYKIGQDILKNRKNSPDAKDFESFVSVYDTNADGKNDIGYLTFADFSTENIDKKTSIQTIMRGNGTNKGANDLLNPNASGYDKTKNDIKDVIVDLTANNGGSVVAEGFLLSWLCGGYATQTLRCAKSKTLSTFTYKFDVNGDNEFSSKDYLPEDINVYILSSRTTYSAANALVYDSYLYNRDSGTKRPVILMGEKSAGGACSIIENLFLPTGLSYQISSCDVAIDPKNTSICSESGVETTSGYSLERNKLAIRTGNEGINAFVRAKHPLSK